MADIENIGDFFKMLFMGPQYFTMKSQEREQEQYATEQADAEKEADIREQSYADMVLKLYAPELMGTTGTIPKTDTPISYLPGMAPKGFEGEDVEQYAEGRTPSAGGAELIAGLESGDIDLQGFMALRSMLGEMGGGMFEEPEAPGDTFDPDQFDLIATLTRGPEGRGGFARPQVIEQLEAMNLDPAMFEAEMNFGYESRPDLLKESAFPMAEQEVEGISPFTLGDTQVRYFEDPENPGQFISVANPLYGYEEPEAADVPDMFRMPSQMGGMFAQHTYMGPDVPTDQVDRQDMMSPVLFGNTDAAMNMMREGGYVGFEHIGTYVDREVRGMEGTGQMSAHARGDAIDITGFYIDVGTDEPLLMSVAEASPEVIAAWKEQLSPYYSTILGPGDPGHEGHLHLEVAGGAGISASEQRRANILPEAEEVAEVEDEVEDERLAQSYFDVPEAFIATQEPLLGVTPAIEDIPYDPENPLASPYNVDESRDKEYTTDTPDATRDEILRRYNEGILTVRQRMDMAQRLVDEHTIPSMALRKIFTNGTIGYGDFIDIMQMIRQTVPSLATT